MGTWQELKNRRFFRIVAAYVGAGWLVLEGMDQFVARALLPELAYRLVLVLYLAGIPAAAIVGWFHGEKGAQRVSKLEVALLVLVAAGGVTAGAAVVERHESQARPVAVGDVESSLALRNLAVLYFDHEPSDADLSPVADGFTEALIRQLGQVSQLDVVSSNGVEPFRGTDLPVDSVARTLQVGTLIRGDVSREGDRLQVTYRLVDGESGVAYARGARSWAADSLLAARDQLVEEVARSLRESLGEEIHLRTARLETRSDAAWLLVQRAEKAYREAEALIAHHRTEEALQRFGRADSLLASASDADPGWAEPWVMRGRIDYRTSRLVEDRERGEALRDQALEHLATALEIDPDNADAIAYRGTIRYLRYLMGAEPDPEAAEQLLRRAEEDLVTATELEPSHAHAWNVLGSFYVWKDDDLEANLAARRAYEADAYHENADANLWRLHTTAYDLENWRQAAHWCQEGHRRFPENHRFVECQVWNMTSPAAEPNVERAWELARRTVQLAPEHDRPLMKMHMAAGVAGTLARAGMADSARSVLASVRPDGHTDPTREIAMEKAFVHTLLGDHDEAVKLLRSYLAANPERREGFVEHGHWWWRDLQDHPGFRRLVGSQEG